MYRIVQNYLEQAEDAVTVKSCPSGVGCESITPTVESGLQQRGWICFVSESIPRLQN